MALDSGSTGLGTQVFFSFPISCAFFSHSQQNASFEIGSSTFPPPPGQLKKPYFFSGFILHIPRDVAGR